jgi:hypothetical protein
VRRYATEVVKKSDDDPRNMRIFLLATFDQDATVRRAAVEMLTGYYLLPPAVLVALVRLLRDDDVATKCWAAAAVGPYRAVVPEMVPSLIAALQDHAEYVREGDEYSGRTVSSIAAESLGNLGALARDAVPALQKLADSADDAQAREKAVEAIAKIQEEAESAASDETDDESEESVIEEDEDEEEDEEEDN